MINKLIIIVDTESEDGNGEFVFDLTKPISIYSCKYTTYVRGIKYGTTNEEQSCHTDGGYRSELSGSTCASKDK